MDIEKRRKENIARLLGKPEQEIASKRITNESVTNNPDEAWEVISIVTKKDKNAYRYADTFKEEIVGTIASKGKGKNIERTNLQTMRDMYSIRNKIVKFATADVSDKYFEYYTGLLEVIDGYALDVVADMYEADSNMFDKVNEIIAAEEQAMRENMKKARNSRSKE